MKGIIFSAPMVRALGEWRKTQTRRLIKPQPPEGSELLEPAMAPGIGKTTGRYAWRHPDGSIHPFRTKYRPGERLYVKEAWRFPKAFDDRTPSGVLDWMGAPEELDDEPRNLIATRYEADGAENVWPGYPGYEARWGRYRHARFMPEWASRYRIEVVSVEPQQIQEISGEDAKAEGISIPECGCEVCATTFAMCPADQSAYIEEFATLITSLRPGTWERNDWYARMEIKLLEDRR